MSHDSINSWVEKAKSNASDGSSADGVKVIRRQDTTRSKGNLVMEIFDKIWPGLMGLFENVRDENGMLMQPAHVRGIALNMAQDLLHRKEAKKKKATSN